MTGSVRSADKPPTTGGRGGGQTEHPPVMQPELEPGHGADAPNRSRDYLLVRPNFDDLCSRQGTHKPAPRQKLMDIASRVVSF